MATDTIYWNRDTSKDIVGNPQTVYTTSATLSIGMSLYNNTGASTGKAVSVINQDGTFEAGIANMYVYRAYGYSSAAGPQGCFVLSSSNDLTEMNTSNTKILVSPTSTVLTDLTNVSEMPYTPNWYNVSSNDISLRISDSCYYGQCTLPLQLSTWNINFTRNNLENCKDVYLYADSINGEVFYETCIWDSTSVSGLSGSSSLSIVNFVNKIYLREEQSTDYYAKAFFSSASNLTNATYDNSDTYIQRTDSSLAVSFNVYANAVCLTGDTLVTMADKSTKRLDEIELGDKVLSLNTDTGELTEDIVIFTDKNENKSYVEYDLWKFSDDYFVKTVHRHRFYNIEDNCFVYMDRWKIGDHTINQEGKSLKLLSHETIKETVRHYKITTEKYHNYFANGMLTGSRLTKAINYKNINIQGLIR